GGYIRIDTMGGAPRLLLQQRPYHPTTGGAAPLGVPAPLPVLRLSRAQAPVEGLDRRPTPPQSGSWEDWVPSRRPPFLVVVYFAVIVASTAVMLWYFLVDDGADNAGFAAIYLVLFAFPTSLLALVPTLIPTDVAGPVSLAVLIAAGFFQVWLLWKVIVDRREMEDLRRRDD
ncbi:MAG: SCO4225 family membrane protein, partial [Sporichthyaceae bacterium]